MNLEIRKADLVDTLAIIDVLNDAVAYKLAHNDSSWGDEPYNEREVRGLIKTNETYAVFLDNELVATFGLHWEDPRIWGDTANNAGYLHRLATKSNMHGKGLGKQVIDWAAQEVAKEGHGYLRLDCDANNKSLCAYYESLGFQEVGKKLIEPHKDYYATLYEYKVKR